jgi:Myb/SANT-like DNA-binding protein
LEGLGQVKFSATWRVQVVGLLIRLGPSKFSLYHVVRSLLEHPKSSRMHLHVRILLIIHNIMKSTRIKKPSNREPKSLAITTPIRTRVPPSSPDQLQQVIDPQILELDAQQLIELAQPDDLPNDLPDNTQQVSWSRSPGYNSPIDDSQSSVDDSQPPVENSQPPVNNSQQLEEELDDKGKVFAWTFELEELMFNELIRQVVDLGKRADSGFKKEAWKEVVIHIQSETGHQISIDRCKNKVDTLKGYWRGFNYLKDQSGFGYNEEKGLFEAEDHVWNAIIRVSNMITAYYIRAILIQVIIVRQEASMASKEPPLSPRPA